MYTIKVHRKWCPYAKRVHSMKRRRDENDSKVRNPPLILFFTFSHRIQLWNHRSVAGGKKDSALGSVIREWLANCCPLLTCHKVISYMREAMHTSEVVERGIVFSYSSDGRISSVCLFWCLGMQIVCSVECVRTWMVECYLRILISRKVPPSCGSSSLSLCTPPWSKVTSSIILHSIHCRMYLLWKSRCERWKRN